MLKEYKEKDDYGYNKILFSDGDIVIRYNNNEKLHGYYSFWCNRKKIFYDKGFYNMGVKYSHWVYFYNFHYYYL